MSTQADVIAQHLAGVPQDEYGEHYHEHLLEQYKIYLELADKISERRSNTNTFFLTVNTGLVSAIGIANFASQKISTALMLLIGISAIVLCFSWYRIIRSYRDLNTAKFKVVHEIEKHLPLRPYDAEWQSVGRGEDKKLYLPFTHVEIWVPWIFIGLYGVLIIYALVKKFV